ncbi:MAG: hypothetical protein NTX22_15045 [Ignavibacteriales bacterium]|nr:hypothetical protein [Ignavibacteriales bacterium]
MKKVFLTIIILFISFEIIFSQSKIQSNLDSVFSKYISQRTKIHEIKRPILESSVEETNKCGTGLVNELRFNFHNLSENQRAILRPLIVRQNLQQSIISASGFFRIHFDTIGLNTPKYFTNLSPYENAKQIAIAFDSSYSFEVGYLQYPPPPKDNGEGGDDLFDIYIIEYNGYGETDFENAIGKSIFTSYILIDNDFSNSDPVVTYGINGALVTAAHELHHAIQGGNYKFDLQDRYFHEMTSTSMEEFVFDSVNDYYQYLRVYFNNPQRSFSQPKDDGYSLAIWNIYLKEKFGDIGFEIIKHQWELYKQDRALTAINQSLAEHQTSFKHELNTFGIWCYFTKKRKIDGKYFKEGASYGPISSTYKINFPSSQPPWTVTTKPLSNNYLEILCNNGTYIDTIYSLITNGDFTSGLNSPGSDFQSKFWIYNFNADGSKHIANSYYSKFEADNKDDYTETNIFNNFLTDTTYYYDVIDFAFPNPFSYRKYSMINLPVENNIDNMANYYIYSIDMNLVYKNTGTIMKIRDKFVMQWTGLDNKNKRLPSGVYIYVTDSVDKIKKGKLVIFNE